jgi:hypothetical protein
MQGNVDVHGASETAGFGQLQHICLFFFFSVVCSRLHGDETARAAGVARLGCAVARADDARR